MPSRQNGFDVVVLGGGPAGCAAALALQQHGIFKTLVVESSHYDAGRIGESIPPDTRLLLEQLGVWPEFLKENHEPCLGSCSSWGSDELGYNDFLFNPHGNGWHLDRARFDRFLAQQAAQRGVEVRTGTTFAALERTDAEGFQLRLTSDDGSHDSVSAAFVIDATGRHAGFARRMGARKVFLDRLTCAAAFFSFPDVTAFPRVTVLEAVASGWWYAARVPNGRIAVAFACDAELMRSAGLHQREAWLAHLGETRHIAPALSACSYIEESLVVRTAPSYLLDRTAGHRWVAAGDAASSYDPISSQGIYKALSTGIEAAAVASSFLNEQKNECDAYEASVAGQFDDYMKSRKYFYGAERRWADAPFWKKRIEQPVQYKGVSL